jgi:ATP-binding cassette, subfamily B, multidrug efflux pump
VTSLIQRAAASQKRINELMEVRPEILWKSAGRTDVKGEIQFRDVNFYYPNTNIKVLENINIHIRPGESLGIIGHTGSGKSTFANLVLRAYDTSTGTICIDGEDIKDIDLGQFRANIGYVPQDDFLFSESIRNNILFGYHGHIEAAELVQQHKLDEMVEEAAKIADVYKDIQEFPDGFNTMLGERGITLSGGQKQRVAIARAIVQNPKILILDDCFSAIDTNTEARILQQLSNVMIDKTSVIISHRVSTVKNATYIIVLSAGQIIEEGKHEDLIKKEGYYYTLYRKQLVEKELFERQKLEFE